MKRLALAGAVVGVLVVYFIVDPGQYLGAACSDRLFSLDCFAGQRAAIAGFEQAHPLALAGVFFAVYVAVTALSVPGAAVMTLVAGALFGLVEGTVIVSFASTIGATLAFLIARFLLRDAVQRRFGRRLAAINRGIERDGAFHLFALRLVPAFPFVVINLAMALTPLRARTFYGVSQLGMLPGTLVYVNAGTRLGQVDSLAGVLSPGVIASFAALGVFPLLARWLVDALARRRALRGYRRPARFDRNLIVIGAGSAGLVASLVAATVKARVTLIEKNAMGGDCLNTGCVPSKALIRSARLAHEIRHAERYGIRAAPAEVSMRDVMARVRAVIATVAPHDSVARYESLGVECIRAGARLVDPWTVETDDGRRLRARAIVLATGAEPVVPAIEGIETIHALTSETLWDLDALPERLVVLGAGPVGCEMSQAFARLGSRVTLIEQREQLLAAEDADMADCLARVFAQEGVDVRLGHRVTRCERRDDTCVVHCAAGDIDCAIECDRVLVAVGRRARTRGMGLEALGIVRDGRIAVDAHLRTAVPTIYACGDAVGGYQLTQAAAHEAWHAAVNALFAPFKRFAVDYSALPWCTFTDPQVAHVGHNERSAAAAGLDYEVTTYDLAELDRAIAESARDGRVKVLTERGRDRILGAAIVGDGAGEWIMEFTQAIRHGLGMNKLLATVHPYPTFGEANRFAAGAWKRAHAPAWALAWLARFHAWRR